MTVTGEDTDEAVVRCRWAAGGSPGMVRYHDLEWGVPVRQERPLFELLTLEGAQAGLSWSTVLARRDGYRRVFAGFDPDVLASWTDDDVDRATLDPGIIRHRGKVASVVANARTIRALRADGTDLVEHLWSFVDGTPLQPALTTATGVPATTGVSEAISRDLKRLGFRFVGPTTMYALMQAAGLTNDHTTECFRHGQLSP